MTIYISDKKGNNRFLVQIVTMSEGRWLVERNSKRHSTFSKKVAMDYDEYDTEMK